MYSIKNLLAKEPVAISAAVLAVVNLGFLFGLYTVTTDQLAGINTAMVLVLGLVRQTVTANANLRKE